MPQLDQFAYVSQVIWLTLSLVVVYFVVISRILPFIYKSLRNRGFMFLSFRSTLIRTEKELFFLDFIFINKSIECLRLLSKISELVLPLLLLKLNVNKSVLVNNLTEDKDSVLVLLEDVEVLGDLNYCSIVDSDVNLSVEDKVNWKRDFLKR